MLPLNDEDADDVDEWAEPGSSLKMLDKYNDVEELALKKKRANRI